MKQVYEITEVKMLVTYSRYDLRDDGTKDLMHLQTRMHDGLLSAEELKAEALTRCDAGIEVVVAEKLN